MQLHTLPPIQFLFPIRPKMRSHQPNVFPLVAKGLNAGKYPGVCVLAWPGLGEEGWLPMGGERTWSYWQGGQVTSPLDFEIMVEWY